VSPACESATPTLPLENRVTAQLPGFFEFRESVMLVKLNDVQFFPNSFFQLHFDPFIFRVFTAIPITCELQTVNTTAVKIADAHEKDAG
jgi:hypothetical protein